MKRIIEIKYSDDLICLNDEKLGNWIRNDYFDSINMNGSGTISILISDLENFLNKNPDCEEKEFLEKDIQAEKDRGNIYIDYDLS
jgi:hypothetical protein